MSELNAFRTELLTDSRNEANLSNGEDSEVSCYTKRALAFIDSTEELGGFPHDCHALGQRSDKSKTRKNKLYGSTFWSESETWQNMSVGTVSRPTQRYLGRL